MNQDFIDLAAKIIARTGGKNYATFKRGTSNWWFYRGPFGGYIVRDFDSFKTEWKFTQETLEEPCSLIKCEYKNKEMLLLREEWRGPECAKHFTRYLKLFDRYM